MPKKNKGRNKDFQHRRTERRNSFSGDEVEDDNASIATDITDSTNHSSNEKNSKQIELDQEKIVQLLDLATEKSVNSRINALIQLKEFALSSVHNWVVYVNNHLTISDILERSIKKGSENEQIAAAKLSSVFIIIMEDLPEAEKVLTIIYPALSKLVQNSLSGLKARKEAAFTLSVLAFYSSYAGVEHFDPTKTLNILHDIFCSIIPKGQGQLPNLSSGKANFVLTALEGMCLLITQLPPSEVYGMARGFLDEFVPVLEYEDIDLKIAVGQALALIHEMARFHNPSFKWKGHAAVVDKLSEFATESSKQIGKKNLKVLKSAFRDIVWTLDEPDIAAENSTEYIQLAELGYQISLDSYALRMQYKSLKYVLGKGANMFLSNNSMLIKQFNVPTGHILQQMSLAEKHPKKYKNNKTGNKIQRRKARDRKTDDFSSEDLINNPFAFWES